MNITTNDVKKYCTKQRAERMANINTIFENLEHKDYEYRVLFNPNVRSAMTLEKAELIRGDWLLEWDNEIKFRDENMSKENIDTDYSYAVWVYETDQETKILEVVCNEIHDNWGKLVQVIGDAKELFIKILWDLKRTCEYCRRKRKYFSCDDHAMLRTFYYYNGEKTDIWQYFFKDTNDPTSNPLSELHIHSCGIVNTNYGFDWLCYVSEIDFCENSEPTIENPNIKLIAELNELLDGNLTDEEKRELAEQRENYDLPDYTECEACGSKYKDKYNCPVCGLHYSGFPNEPIENMVHWTIEYVPAFMWSESPLLIKYAETKRNDPDFAREITDLSKKDLDDDEIDLLSNWGDEF